MKQINIDYRLYLVTDRTILGGKSFIHSIEEAILGGVTLIQLREKHSTALEFYQLGLKVKELTAKYNIPLIINDRIDIAVALNADGVHVGQKDLPCRVVRKLIGDSKILGVSAATLEEAEKAEMEGADYIGVGALFPTGTKEDTREVTLDNLRNIKKTISIPVIGIGGINKHNIEAVKTTGIDGAAVVSAILSQKNIKEASRYLYEKLT
ncbi:thiamine phosphate synthase [Alkaliphilus pronyensis]|uniref:Thiamine-phosphate synthase n=1 Tax=Alkaliphilus pronyensis TaxID=1482732 RepID=A0A6I0FCP6_9FIRM|nr:thiamine phosphate synthase [Alkaliphilus pronyensis]KAB3531313.1 thiamine phosphate synthase [Alkaliphilus pronyensis]